MRAAATGPDGMVLAIAMSVDIVDILSRWHLGQRHDGTPLVMGFHLYSLLLLGTVLTALGLWLLRAAVSLATGDARGLFSHALGATLCALAIVVPLIPIQAFFAVPLSVLGGVGVAAATARPMTAESCQWLSLTCGLQSGKRSLPAPCVGHMSW